MEKLNTRTANPGSYKTFQCHFIKLALTTKAKLIKLSEFLSLVGGV
jgi:hypothetical protein